MKFGLVMYLSLIANFVTIAQQTALYKDKTSPTISCKEDLKIVTQTGFFEISASQVVLNYIDNKTEPDQLILSFDKQYPVDTLLHRRHLFIDGKLASTNDYKNFKAYSWDPNTKIVSKRFSHLDIGNGMIELDATVFDETKNFSICKVRIEVSHEASKEVEKVIND